MPHPRRNLCPKKKLTFCDPLRLEPECSLNKHTRRVCSRGFRAARSCLLPALCTPNRWRGISSLLRKPEKPTNWARSSPRNFTKSGPRFSRNLCRNSPEESWPIFFGTEKFPAIFRGPPWQSFSQLLLKIWFRVILPTILPWISALRDLLFGVQVMHCADLQGFNALVRSKMCTMLLAGGGGLRTVTVIRQPRDQ